MENKTIICYEEVDSTNTRLKELAMQGAVHQTVVTAKRQTAGKGRRGRTWVSDAKENIYMSILLRPKVDPSKAPMLTLVMAYSAAVALRNLGYSSVGIKWPNDLVMSGKKLCGILTEMSLSGQQIEYVIIGLGLNVNTKVFPEDLQGHATSLFLETDKEAECEIIQNEILKVFEKAYERFIAEENLKFLRDEYHSMLLNRGKEVRVLEPGSEYTAQAIGINEFGELLVQKNDGTVEAVYAGEVSVRGIYGYVN